MKLELLKSCLRALNRKHCVKITKKTLLFIIWKIESSHFNSQLWRKFEAEYVASNSWYHMARDEKKFLLFRITWLRHKLVWNGLLTRSHKHSGSESLSFLKVHSHKMVIIVKKKMFDDYLLEEIRMMSYFVFFF